MAWGALAECSVPNTKWPVSAAHAGSDGLGVPHLADQDHIRVLAHQGGQGLFVVEDIQADLSLGDDPLAVFVQILDRVFNGHDVTGPRTGNVVQHGRNGGGLAAPRGPYHQDQALRTLRDLAQGRRQMQGFKRRYGTVDPSGRQTDVATLAKDIDAEPTVRVTLVGEVQGPVLEESLLLIGAEDLKDHLFQLLGGQGLARGTLEAAQQA